MNMKILKFLIFFAILKISTCGNIFDRMRARLVMLQSAAGITTTLQPTTTTVTTTTTKDGRSVDQIIDNIYKKFGLEKFMPSTTANPLAGPIEPVTIPDSIDVNTLPFDCKIYRGRLAVTLKLIETCTEIIKSLNEGLNSIQYGVEYFNQLISATTNPLEISNYKYLISSLKKQKTRYENDLSVIQVKIDKLKGEVQQLQMMMFVFNCEQTPISAQDVLMMTFTPNGCSYLPDLIAQLKALITFSENGVKVFQSSLTEYSIMYLQAIAKVGRSSGSFRAPLENVATQIRAVIRDGVIVNNKNKIKLDLTKNSLNDVQGIFATFCQNNVQAVQL